MRPVISASLFVLACALAQPAFAQLHGQAGAYGQGSVPHPMFSNDYLILLNVNIPPGRNTSYHIHYANSVSVNLTPASQTNQAYGSSEVSAPGAGGDGEPGRTTFTNVTKDGPRTHKASNVGPTHPQHLLHLEKSRASQTRVSDRSGVAGYTQIMDNARIRAWRVVLPNRERRPDRSRKRHRDCGSTSTAAYWPKSSAIGRSRHGPVRRRFHLAGCRADQGGEEHRYHAHRIRRVRAEIGPARRTIGR